MAGDPLISIYAMKLQAMREQRRVEEERSIREKEIERATINDAFDRTIKGYQANLQAEAALDKMQFGVHKQMADQRMAEMETLRKERELKLKEAEVRQQSLADLESRKEFQTTERVAGQLGRTAEAKRKEEYQTSDKYIAAQVEIQKARALAIQPAKTQKEKAKLDREQDKLDRKTFDDSYKTATKRRKDSIGQLNNEIDDLDRKIKAATVLEPNKEGWEHQRDVLHQQREALKHIYIIRTPDSVRKAEAEMEILMRQTGEQVGQIQQHFGTYEDPTQMSEEEKAWKQHLRRPPVKGK